MLNFAPDISAMDQQNPEDGNEHVAMVNVAQAGAEDELLREVDAGMLVVMQDFMRDMEKKLQRYKWGSMSLMQQAKLIDFFYGSTKSPTPENNVLFAFLKKFEEVAPRCKNIEELISGSPAIMKSMMQLRLQLSKMKASSEIAKANAVTDGKLTKFMEEEIQSAERCITVFETPRHNPMFMQVLSDVIMAPAQFKCQRGAILERFFALFGNFSTDADINKLAVALQVDSYKQFFYNGEFAEGGEIVKCSPMALSEFIKGGGNDIPEVVGYLIRHIETLNECEKAGVLKQGCKLIMDPAVKPLFDSPYSAEDGMNGYRFDRFIGEDFACFVVASINKGREDILHNIIGQGKIGALKRALIAKFSLRRSWGFHKNTIEEAINLAILSTMHNSPDNASALFAIETLFHTFNYIGIDTAKWLQEDDIKDAPDEKQKIAGAMIETLARTINVKNNTQEALSSYDCIREVIRKHYAPNAINAFLSLVGMVENEAAVPNAKLLPFRDAFTKIQNGESPEEVLSSLSSQKQ